MSRETNEANDRAPERATTATIAAGDYQAGAPTETRSGEDELITGVPEVTLVADRTGGSGIAADGSVDPRQQLLGRAREQMQPEQFANFQLQMQHFERLNVQRPEEIPAFYKEVARLLDRDERSVLPEEQRLGLVIDTMRAAAVPSSINQGLFDTCSAAALQTRIFTRHPSDGARLIVDMAMDGKYVASDGTTVAAPAGLNTMTDQRSADGTTPASLADRVFQVTAVNLLHDIAGTGLRYAQGGVNGGRARDVVLTADGDTVEGKGAGIGTAATRFLQDVNTAIVGIDEGNFIISAETVRTESELKDLLADLRRNGNEPAIAVVNVGNQPFRSRSVPGGAPFHVITASPDSTGADAFRVHDQQAVPLEQSPNDRDFRFTTEQLTTALRSTPDALLPDVYLDLIAITTPEKAKELPGLLRNLEGLAPEALSAAADAYERKTGQSLRSRLVTLYGRAAIDRVFQSD